MNNEKNHNEDLKIPGINAKKLRSGPFKTPEGYFEKLTPRMMDAVKESQHTGSKGFLLDGLFRKVLAPAFGVIAIVVVAFLVFQNNAQPDLDTQFAALANDLQFEQIMFMDDVMPLDLAEADLVNLELGQLDDEEIDITEYLLENEVELSTLVDEILL